MSTRIREAAELLGVSDDTVRCNGPARPSRPKSLDEPSERLCGPWVDRDLRALVERYVDAWERCDVAASTALLVEYATFAIPPMATWDTPRDSITSWPESSRCPAQDGLGVCSSQNGFLAPRAFYAWDGPTGTYLPFALNILCVRGNLISGVPISGQVLVTVRSSSERTLVESNELISDVNPSPRRDAPAAQRPQVSASSGAADRACSSNQTRPTACAVDPMNPVREQ